MKGQITGGNIAGVPYNQTVIDFDTADATLILGAATGLIKVVAGAALIGAGIAAGISIIGAILSGLQSSLSAGANRVPTSNLPLGSAPTWITTGEGAFWGIVLDSDLVMLIIGRPLILPYSTIYKLQMSVGGFFNLEDRIRVQLVDGSHYYGYRQRKDGFTNNVWPRTTHVQVATIGGIQNIPIKTANTTGVWIFKETREYAERVDFNPARVEDISRLRNDLKYVLRQNNRHISNLIGQNILQTFFNVPQIP
jgi:hypothetical protein